MYNLSTAWSLLKGLYPREIILDDPIENPTHETWTQVPSAMGSSIVVCSGMTPLSFYKVWAYDGGVYTDETTAAGNDTANDMTLMPADGGASGDAYYFGFSGFSVVTNSLRADLWINMGTAGSGNPTLKWEYDNGTAWVAADYVMQDGTSSFLGTTGWKNIIIYPGIFGTLPFWTQTSVNGTYAWWMRARLTAGSYTTIPSGTRAGYPAQLGEAITGFSQPVPARNLWVSCTNNSGGNTGGVYIYGRDAMGSPITDAIGVNQYGVNPFASLRAISMRGGPMNEMVLIGWGTILGLSNKLMHSSDGFAWQKNASLGTPVVTALAKGLGEWPWAGYYNTIDVGTIASGDQYHLWYVGRDLPRKPLRDIDATTT
jgi:hypothetical protein